MTQYIDKEKVEKILRNLWKEDDRNNSEHRIYYNKALQQVQCEIDTLEAKEVDLEKEYEEFVVDDPIFGNFITNDTMGMKLAEHFFELGLKVAQKGE